MMKISLQKKNVKIVSKCFFLAEILFIYLFFENASLKNFESGFH